MDMSNLIKRNWTYFFWFLFYIALFERVLMNVLIWYFPFLEFILYWPRVAVYLLIFGVAVLFLAVVYSGFEPLWRLINGVRPLRLDKEIDRLHPIFMEVYKEALKRDRNLSRRINLYIDEDININAYAFGSGTLILTKGSIMLLNDDDLRGLIAHELGHFANKDTIIALITTICNLPMSLLMMFFDRTKPKIDEASKKSFIIWVLKGFFDIYYYLLLFIRFISELIIMHQCRGSEYRADMYALRCGYGIELAEVLSHLYETSISKPGTVKEMMRATHPHITKRIERLEVTMHYLREQEG